MVEVEQGLVLCAELLTGDDRQHFDEFWLVFLCAERENTKCVQSVKSAIYYFKKYDGDMSGALDVDEFRAMCREMNWADEDIDGSLRLLDADGDGEISFNEFLTWCAARRAGASSQCPCLPWSVHLVVSLAPSVCCLFCYLPMCGCASVCLGGVRACVCETSKSRWRWRGRYTDDGMVMNLIKTYDKVRLLSSNHVSPLRQRMAFSVTRCC